MGTNNLGHRKDTPQACADNIRAFVRLVRRNQELEARIASLSDSVSNARALLAAVYGLAYSYVFANAAEVVGRTAVAALSGDTSLNDLENLAHMVQIIPWLVVGLYVIGILVNAVSNRQK